MRVRASQVVLVVKNSPASAENIRDVGSIPGWKRSPGGGRGNPLQYSCPENPMDRGPWWAMVHSVAKSWTRLSTHALCEKQIAAEVQGGKGGNEAGLGR